MANLKNTTVDDNLELPSGTTGQRPSSPQEGQIRYNTDTGVTEFYNGANWRPLSDTHPEATGGTVVDTDINGVPYRIHYFTNVGTETLTVTNPGEVEYLIVAGGGGGASREGCGGGGAGGVLQGKTNLDSQPYSITVGDGGLGGLGGTSPYVGSSGENSIALGLTAIGGGRGVLGTNQGGLDGGSGGGSGRGGGAGGQAVSGQGNNGGDGADQAGGGGGGGGSPGENGVANTKSGDGGQGILTTITGINQIIAGGGGGGARPAVGGARHGVGGLGGGGTGGKLDASYFDGRPGVPNTGSGGGGGAGSTNSDIGGKGGSGIVIVRYPKNSTFTTQPDRTVIATQPNRFQIVQDGLIAYIDPGDPVSYPGTGSTVYDLSGQGANGTLNGNVAFLPEAGGCFTFDGSNSDDISSSLSQDYQDFTMFFNISPNARSFFGVIGTGRATSFLDDAFRGSFDGSTFDLSSRNPGDVNDWAYPSGTTYYVNGVPSNSCGLGWNCWGGYRTNRGSFSAGNSFPYHLGTSAYTGRNFTGKIGVALFYNRQLTEAEQVQNFNALRGRYGI